MSHKWSKQDVLRHLTFLGYKEINDQQLKEFCRDLKKLMKFHDRYGEVLRMASQEQIKNLTYVSQKLPECTCIRNIINAEVVKNPPKSTSADPVEVTDRLHKRHTVESKSKLKDPSKMTHTIQVEINPTIYSKNEEQTEIVKIDKSTVKIRIPRSRSKSNETKNSRIRSSSQSQKEQQITPSMSPTELCPLDSSTPKSGVSTTGPLQVEIKNTKEQENKTLTERKDSGTQTYKEAPKIRKTSWKDSKPKSSVIKPTFVKFTKDDPVSRYNQYQQEWAKYNIPGEHGRTALRWNVRERMAQVPKCR